jgi:hypothetical protein
MHKEKIRTLRRASSLVQIAVHDLACIPDSGIVEELGFDLDEISNALLTFARILEEVDLGARDA